MILLLYYRATIIIKCDMDFVLYPLDVQTCAVDFGSRKLIFIYFNIFFNSLLYYNSNNNNILCVNQKYFNSGNDDVMLSIMNRNIAVNVEYFIQILINEVPIRYID